MRHLERIYPWLLAAPIILPLVVWSGLIYPYLVPKTLLFYALSLLSLAVFVLLAASGRAFYYARLKDRIARVPIALLVLACLSSAFGIDFYRSLWSVFIRGDGLLMLAFVVFNFYLILLYADKQFFTYFVRAVAWVGSFVALYGIGEWLFAGGRVGSLLGNAAFFAGYLGITFFVTLLASVRLNKDNRNLAYAGAALQLVAIVLTATRGTIVALGAALAAYLIYIAFSQTGKTKQYASGILIAGIVLVGLFFVFRGELAKVPFEPISRIATISRADNDVSSRLFIWQHMTGEVVNGPVLGVGSEHIDVLFNRFYDPSKISEQWFDRSHNAYLDYAAQYGVFGLLLYLALIAGFFVAAYRLKATEPKIAGLISLLAITYAVQNFFVFDTVTSFWLLLALLALSLSLSKPSTERVLNRPSWSIYPAILIALLLIVRIYPLSVRPLVSAYDLAHAYLYAISDVSKETAYLKAGLGTYGDLEYGYESYDMYVNYQQGRVTPADATTAYNAMLPILTNNFNRFPYDARTALYLAHVLSLAPASTTVDSMLFRSAIDRAIKLSPLRAQPWFIKVNIELSKANAYPIGSPERAAQYSAAKNILTQYIALVPKLSEPHYVFADLDLAAGDKGGAAVEAALGKQYYQGDLETAVRAVGYYESVLDLPNAEYFLMEVLRNDPGNKAASDDLAKVKAYEAQQ